MTTTDNSRADALTDEQIATLKQTALAVTPQDIDSAERIENRPDGSYLTCPACEGEGSIPFEADYCNYDHIAIGVQFYGIGTAPGAAEAYFRAASPANILALLARLERAESALAASPVEQHERVTAKSALAAIETFEIVGENNDSREPNADDRFILTEFIAHAFGGYPVEQHEAAPAEHDVNQLLEAAALGLERAGMLDSMRIVRGMKPGYPKQPAPSAPLEGTGNGADERDVLNRLVVILESGQAYNGIAHDNAAIYAKALRDLLESRAPRTEVAGVEGAKPPIRSLEDVRADEAEHQRFRYWQQWFVNHSGYPMEPVDAWQIRATLDAAPPAQVATREGLTDEQQAAIKTAIGLIGLSGSPLIRGVHKHLHAILDDARTGEGQ